MRLKNFLSNPKISRYALPIQLLGKGDHGSIIENPNVEVLAFALNEVLEQCNNPQLQQNVFTNQIGRLKGIHYE